MTTQCPPPKDPPLPSPTPQPDRDTAGHQGETQGIHRLWNGDGFTPGTPELSDSTGTIWTIWVTVTGTAKVNQGQPGSDNDGTVIGTQF